MNKRRLQEELKKKENNMRKREREKERKKHNRATEGFQTKKDNKKDKLTEQKRMSITYKWTSKKRLNPIFELLKDTKPKKRSKKEGINNTEEIKIEKKDKRKKEIIEKQLIIDEENKKDKNIKN